jgi:hypothetical protein
MEEGFNIHVKSHCINHVDVKGFIRPIKSIGISSFWRYSLIRFLNNKKSVDTSVSATFIQNSLA